MDDLRSTRETNSHRCGACDRRARSIEGELSCFELDADDGSIELGTAYFPVSVWRRAQHQPLDR